MMISSAFALYQTCEDNIAINEIVGVCHGHCRFERLTKEIPRMPLQHFRNMSDLIDDFGYACLCEAFRFVPVWNIEVVFFVESDHSVEAKHGLEKKV